MLSFKTVSAGRSTLAEKCQRDLNDQVVTSEMPSEQYVQQMLSNFLDFQFFFGDTSVFR